MLGAVAFEIWQYIHEHENINNNQMSLYALGLFYQILLVKHLTLFVIDSTRCLEIYVFFGIIIPLHFQICGGQ